MNKKNDPNFIARFERAIIDRYGDESIEPPQNGWNEEKEKEYLEQLKIISSQEQNQKEEIIENQDYLIQKKLFIKGETKICLKCNMYTKYIIDDLYLLKFGMCHKCFLMQDDINKRNKK